MIPQAQPAGLFTASTPTSLDPAASVDGKSVSFAEALSRAANLLKAARMPLIVAGADFAGVNAALDLAEEVEAAFAVVNQDAVSCEFRAAEDYGCYQTSRREAKARADVVLAIGKTPAAQAQSLLGPGATLPSVQRAYAMLPSEGAGKGNDLKIELSLLAALAGPDVLPVLQTARFDSARATAAKLRSGRFGVAVWSPGELDQLEVGALMLLLDHLNIETRFSALPLRPGGNGWGAAQTCLARWGAVPPARWLAGRASAAFPSAASFRVVPEGVDLILSVSSFANSPPQLADPLIPVIAIGPGAAASGTGKVAIEAGVTGADHAGLYYDEGRDAVIAVEAARSGGKISAADIVLQLLSRIRGDAA